MTIIRGLSKTRLQFLPIPEFLSNIKPPTMKNLVSDIDDDQYDFEGPLDPKNPFKIPKVLELKLSKDRKVSQVDLLKC